MWKSVLQISSYFDADHGTIQTALSLLKGSSLTNTATLSIVALVLFILSSQIVFK